MMWTCVKIIVNIINNTRATWSSSNLCYPSIKYNTNSIHRNLDTRVLDFVHNFTLYSDSQDSPEHQKKWRIRTTPMIGMAPCRLRMKIQPVTNPKECAVTIKPFMKPSAV